MSAGMKALHNVLLRAQYLEGVDHIFSSTVRDAFCRLAAKPSCPHTQRLPSIRASAYKSGAWLDETHRLLPIHEY